MFLPMFSLINLYLIFFNLLPIPPLDGSSVFAFFLPEKVPAHVLQGAAVRDAGVPDRVLLVPYVLHVNPVGVYLDVTAGNVVDLLFPFSRIAGRACRTRFALKASRGRSTFCCTW